MKVKISCELYIQYDEWLESVKATVDLVKDCLLDIDEEMELADSFTVSTCLDDNITVIYFPSVSNNYIRKMLIAKMASYSNIRVMDVYVDHDHHDGHDESIVYFEDSSENMLELEVEKLSIGKKVTYLFGENVDVHIEFINQNSEQYYLIKQEISQELLGEISSVSNIKSVDNLLSDYILFMMMPNIIYDKTDKVMYAYNKTHGWEPYDKNKLHFDISNTSKNLFANHDTVLSYLGSYSTRRDIVSDVHIKIMGLCAIEKMDTKNIIGMKNMLYNTESLTFEEFNPKYFLNCSTHIWYSDDTYYTDMLNGILELIFPQKGVRDVVLRWFGYAIEFGNPEKLLTIWHGPSGNNGKSWLQRLFKEALGDYCRNIPVSLLTNKRGTSNSATPDISMLENKLITFLQEPDYNEKIHSGKAKEYTGNDSVYTRDLYKSARNIDIWAKLVIVSNNKLETIGLDAAMKRRFMVIPFTSTFVSQHEYDQLESKEGYFVRKDLDGMCKKLAPSFMKLLIEQHKCYRARGLEVTQEIHDYTSNFILATNRTLKFIKTYIVKAPDQGVSLVSLYEHFKTWHKQWYPSKSLPSMEIFLDELAKDSYKIVEGSYIENVQCTYSGF